MRCGRGHRDYCSICHQHHRAAATASSVQALEALEHPMTGLPMGACGGTVLLLKLYIDCILLISGSRSLILDQCRSDLCYNKDRDISLKHNE